MKHAAKFDISPRGRKTKYYTCQQCGFVCSGWSLKDAREQHKAYLMAGESGAQSGNSIMVVGVAGFMASPRRR